MADTIGFVQRLKWDAASTTMYAYIGPDPAGTAAFTVGPRAGDSDVTVSGKRMAMRLLEHAQLRGVEVSVSHPDNGSGITAVKTLAPDVTSTPVQLDALEVTQSIQDLAHSIPLVAAKKTVVRLYLSNYAGTAVTVQGRLALRRSPTDPLVSVSSSNNVTLNPADAGNIWTKRDDATKSLNFLLPDTHTVEGPLTIAGITLLDAGTGAAVTLGQERRPTVRFIASPPLRVRVIGIRYRMGTPPVTYVPSTLDFALLPSWLGRAYPAGQVIYSQTIVDATPTPPFSSGQINAQVAAIRALDVGSGTDARTHYYGFVADGGFFMRGSAAGIPQTPDPSVVASGPTGSGTWGWDFDGSYGDWYGGHELGHTFGRYHPGFCGESQNDLQNYPYPNGQLAGSDQGFTGFDVGDPAQGLPMTARPGTTWHDVMTYCSTQWLSPYTYRGIRTRLIAEGS